MGEEEWPENPRWMVPDAFHALVRLWATCRIGMGGYGSWPDAGGVNEQAAWLLDAFAVLSGAEADLDRVERDRRGGG